MSNKSKQSEKPTPAKTKVEEKKFYIHVLREHSQELFGVKPEVLDGAFFNVKETQLTKADAEKRIKTFLNKEVKQ
jgi:hypothetical protein